MSEQLSTASLGLSYGWSRQLTHQYISTHGREVVADPDRLFAKMLETGRASKVRAALANPARRDSVRRRLALAAERELHRDAVRKLTRLLESGNPKA